jgi:hypothetical protein
MNDYFGALLRSSGIAVDAEASSFSGSTQGAQPISDDYGIQEVYEERIAAPDAASVRTPFPSDPLVTSSERPRTFAAAEHADIPARPAVDLSTLSSPARVSGAYATSTPNSTTAPRLPIPAQGESTHPTRQDRLDHEPDLVHAAFRWIAAGENAVQAVPETAVASEFASQDVTEERQPHGMGTLPTGTSAVDERLKSMASPVSVEHGTHFRTTFGNERLRSIASPLSAQSASEQPIESQATLRADAPPPATATLRAPSAATRPVSERPLRSGLSRRALWRI